MVVSPKHSLSENHLEQREFLDHLNLEAYQPLSGKDEAAWCQEISDAEHALWEEITKNAFAPLVLGRWLSEQKIELPLLNVPKSVLKNSVDELRFRHDCDREIQRAAVRLVAGSAFPKTLAWRNKVLKLARDLDQKKNEFVKQNIRLVAVVAKRYGHTGRKWTGAMSLGDAMQEGCVGLMRALNRFDVNRGLRFSTFAVFWIRACISRAVADQQRTVRTPVHLLDTAARAGKKMVAHLAKTGEHLTAEELSACTDLSVQKARETIAFIRTGHGATTVSIDHSSEDDSSSGSGSGDMYIQLRSSEPSAEALLISSEEPSALDALRVLDPLEARVVRWKCGLESDEKNMREIGDELNLSRERVRQIYAVALEKMKEEITCGNESD